MTFPKLYENVRKILRLNEAAAGAIDGPKGVTVHYTASGNVDQTVSYLISQNLGYHILIDKDGKTTQMVDFQSRCNHAGKADWNGNSPNRSHIAVALISWGELEASSDLSTFRAWTGHIVPAEDVVVTNGKFWDAATKDQISALMIFLHWCVQFGIHPDQICGHEECAIPLGRKADPGGVLDPMAAIRSRLKLGRKAGQA